MLRWACIVCTMATLTWASLASGQPLDSRAAQARKHCLTGNVEAGVALLADLFVETKDVNLIYNQARCYEQNGRDEPAILRFREYLRVAKHLTAEEKAEVERHIADCRAMQTEGKPAAEPVPSQPVPASIPTSAPPPTAVPPTAADVTAAASPEPASGSSSSSTRLAGIVIGGAGIAALATGGVFSYLVSSAKQEVRDNADKKVYDSSLNSRGKTYETMQWVCYGTGAALVATGIVLYAVGARKGSQAKTVAVMPSLAPGQGGLLLQGRF
jgi:hypothetical protein